MHQDIIFHTERCNTFVIGMPYPWAEKLLGEGTPRQRELAFRSAKADLANYQDLSRALDVVHLRTWRTGDSAYRPPSAGAASSRSGGVSSATPVSASSLSSFARWLVSSE
jgi:hypothetical protein